MRLPENFWRLEADTTNLTVQLVRRSMSKEKIVKTASMSGKEKDEQLRAILDKTSNRIFLSLSRDQGIARQLQLPMDVQQDLRSVLALQIEAISAWPENDAYWDYIVEKGSDKLKWLAITIVVIPKSVLDPWLQLFESWNLQLSGATLGGYNLNVIPARLRGASARLQLVASYALAGCVLLVGLVFLLRGPYQQRAYAAQIQQEISRLEPQVKSLVREESELSALTKRYSQLQKHLRNRDRNLEALDALATVLPPETFVFTYRYQTETVTVSGVSASALNVQSALEKSAVFRDVQFAAPITREPSGKDRFSLTMSLKGQQ